MADPSIARFRKVVSSACAQLEARRQEVNDLNVFPVADGDTGDNMVQTLRSVMEALDRLNGAAIDDIGRDEIVSAVARAALLGARGNSGVILSQIVRGAAEELSSRPGELVDPVLVSAALARAADAAYSSVRDPAEGTMITVVREMALRVATELAHMETPRLGPGATDAEQDAVLAEVLEKALDAAESSVERSPELLPILREHGVVDAGGYGIALLVAGVVAGLRGEGDHLHEVAHHAAPLRPHAPGHSTGRFRFCTNFVVSGRTLEEAPSYVSRLEEIGDSVLVVGDRAMMRVHVHTDHPERAAALFDGTGAVERFDVADMNEQLEQRSARLAGDRNGAPAAAPDLSTVVAVTAGAGMRILYEQLGAYVVDGGATLNPSTFELLAGIHAAPGSEVVVLPNSGNVIMAADRAAELSEKQVVVVESRWPHAGLASVIEHDPRRPAAENAARMREVLEGLRVGAVAPAARDDKRGRFAEGDAVGFLDEDIVAWGRPAETLQEVFERLAPGTEVLTVVSGEGAPLDGEAVAGLAPGGVKVESHAGDQPHYWWLVAAE